LLLGDVEPWAEPVELDGRSRRPAVLAVMALLVVLAVAATVFVLDGETVRNLTRSVMELLGG
jgi:hypothetical protein